MGVSHPGDWDLQEEVGEGWDGLHGDQDVRGRWGRGRRWERERGESWSPLASLHTDESSDEFATDSVRNERTLSTGSSSVKQTTQNCRGFKSKGSKQKTLLLAE